MWRQQIAYCFELSGLLLVKGLRTTFGLEECKSIALDELNMFLYTELRTHASNNMLNNQFLDKELAVNSSRRFAK